MQYCVILPVYNHPDYIADLLDYLSAFQLPIILVNDGSDATCSALLRQLASDSDGDGDGDGDNNQIILLEHAHNQGKGQAVITGLTHAHGLGLSHALQIDADGQHDWQDIAKFIEISQQNPQAMVIGAPQFDQSVPKKRLYGRYATHIWVWINSLSFDIQDSMCGFRVYPVAQTMQILTNNKIQTRMGFDSEILVRLKWENVSFINVPTRVIYPEHGISHFQLWRDNLGISQTHARLLAGMLIRLPKLLKNKLLKHKLFPVKPPVDKPILKQPKDGV